MWREQQPKCRDMTKSAGARREEGSPGSGLHRPAMPKHRMGKDLKGKGRERVTASQKGAVWREEGNHRGRGSLQGSPERGQIRRKDNDVYENDVIPLLCTLT